MNFLKLLILSKNLIKKMSFNIAIIIIIKIDFFIQIEDQYKIDEDDKL